MAINAPSTLSVVAHKYKARAGYLLFQLSFIYSSEETQGSRGVYMLKPYCTLTSVTQLSLPPSDV